MYEAIWDGVRTGLESWRDEEWVWKEEVASRCDWSQKYQNLVSSLFELCFWNVSVFIVLDRHGRRLRELIIIILNRFI